MKKLSILLALSLALCLCAAASLAATANATVVAPETVKITAPFSGTLLPFDLTTGDQVAAGQTLFTLDATPVYAPIAGKVAAVFGAAGDDAAGVASHYGSVVVIEPEHPLYIAASTDNAYNKDENRYIHAGESVYLKSGDIKGTGVVTSVDGKHYVVEVLSGDYELDDTVHCYRESSMPYDSDIGRGRIQRYADTAVVGAGRIVSVQVKRGDTVRVGDVLFETVDAQSAPSASRTIRAEIGGAITAMNTISGAQVYRDQLLCEIADLTKFELSAEVDEIDLASISVGSALSFTLDAYPGETFSGTVTEIRPIAAQKQNAAYFDVRLSIPSGKTVLPGMNATVTID